MKNLGEVKKEVRALRAEVDHLKRQMEAVIEIFCKDAFENIEPPEPKGGPFVPIDPAELEIDEEDLP